MRGRDRISPMVSGGVTATLLLVVVAAILVTGLPGGGPQLPFLPHGTSLRAELSDAHGLQPNAAVQIAGVKVGKVTSIDAGPSGTAMVSMSLDPQYADVHPDATVALRPHGLLGPKFIDLTPGTGDAQGNTRLAAGDVIPERQSSQPVDLSQILNTLQDNEQQQLKTVTVELGTASEGRGDDVNHLLAASRSLTALLDSPVKALDSVSPNLNEGLVQMEAFNNSFQNAPLQRTLEQSNRALKVLAENSDTIGALLTDANRTLGQLDGVLAGQQGALRQTIEALPPTLDRVDSLMNLLGLFGANLTGKEPGYSDVTPGIIGAIENVRSAAAGSNPCTPGQGTCPPDGRSHYVRIQTFGLAPTDPLGVCGGQVRSLPVLGGVVGDALSCKASAPATPGQPVQAAATIGPADLTTLAEALNPRT